MSFFKQKSVLILLALTVIFVGLNLVVLLSHNNLFGRQLILHFDSVYGANKFGIFTDVWTAFGVIIFLIALNIFFAKEFFYKERIVSYFLLSLNPLFTLLFLIGFSALLNVN